MDTVLFAKEQTREVPGCSLDGRPHARLVRVYIKGPTKGIDAKTRILVNVHGAGGRQLNIDYKRFRHEVSDAYNCLVIGVDFFGTESRWADPLFFSREKARIIASLQSHLPSFDTSTLVDRRGHSYVDPSRGWYCDSECAASEWEKSIPKDAWDFGFIQALDVLSALQVILREWECLSLPLPSIHFFSRSAGSQISALCMALCPQVLCSIANIAPFMMSSHHRRIVELLLTNPIGDIQSAHHSSINLECRGKVTHVLRKVPVPFPGGVRGIPNIEDQRDVRLIDNKALWQGVHTEAEVISWRGANDLHMPKENLEAIHSCMTAIGAKCTINHVTDDMVDGNIFTSSNHDLISDMRKTFISLSERILIGNRQALSPKLWTDRKLSSVNGHWHIKWDPSPHYFFEPSRDV